MNTKYRTALDNLERALFSDYHYMYENIRESIISKYGYNKFREMQKKIFLKNFSIYK